MSDETMHDSLRLAATNAGIVKGIIVSETAAGPTKFLEQIVILYFEKRYPKENSVIHLKSNIPPSGFGPGALLVREASTTGHRHPTDGYV